MCRADDYPPYDESPEDDEDERPRQKEPTEAQLDALNHPSGPSSAESHRAAWHQHQEAHR